MRKGQKRSSQTDTYSGQSQTSSMRPRQYAQRFLSAKSKEEQKIAVEGCPVEYRELVKKHVENYRELKNVSRLRQKTRSAKG